MNLVDNRRAYILGKLAKLRGHIRVSPFWQVKELVDGLLVDVTPERDRCWYAGFDGQSAPQIAISDFSRRCPRIEPREPTAHAAQGALPSGSASPVSLH